ncbi:DUF3000 domain-containing protein [Falsarthrobacter nasiphocae]
MSPVPRPFRIAVESLAAVPHRTGVTLSEVPSPKSAAPFSVSLEGETLDCPAGERAHGRFMLLFDPDPRAEWGSSFRVVTFVRADLDESMGNDPLLSAVAWDWLTDALHAAGAEHERIGGHATRVLKESFGELAGSQPMLDVELRASWTPRGGLGAHLEAWQSVLASFAGLPPELNGAAPLPGVRFT